MSPPQKHFTGGRSSFAEYQWCYIVLLFSFKSKRQEVHVVGKHFAVEPKRIKSGNSLRLLALLLCAVAASASGANTRREQAIKIVSQIQRADYEGDRASLRSLTQELLPFEGDKELAVRVRYWRGFAYWRRAINGFNETPTPSDLEADLQAAVDEFEKASALDPEFADAKIGMASCLGNILYLHMRDPAQVQAFVARISPVLRDLMATSADNPRLYWVLGPVYWSTPVDRGGGQDKAFEMYQKGLKVIAIKNHEASQSDPLEPSWGEPEILMSLAWSSLNRTEPDLDAANRYANSALDLVPYWHYVRDILMPQIRQAKARVEKR